MFVNCWKVCFVCYSVMGELKLIIVGIYPSDNPFHWLTIYHMFLHVELSVGF